MHTDKTIRHGSMRRENRVLLYDALILDARLRQSLVTVRSLGSRGLRPIALETFDGAPAFSSRWCQQKFICPADEGTAEYLSYLERVLDSTGARVLITSSDATAALIRQNRERLERRVSIALAKEPALGIAVNKEQTLEIAVRAGVDFPHLLYQWANGECIDVVKDYHIGLWMRYLGGDFAATLASLRQYGRPGVRSPAHAIFDFCASFFVPMSYDYLDLKDPLPVWTAMIGFPRSLLRREG